ncbi:hypothetical protein [Rugosimonospora africana]|uniref:Uncharacterized protein n=1 Tax=Rugosimonospora africana TaxID=556532 RepID=A0A8J3VWC4_9ACTN|nr:hypothetical protein [Rugosimonospora africana]GIH20696.1 hypothetical protein Raf01_88680 [Rugosimonospora africana]
MTAEWVYPRLPAGVAEELLHSHSTVDSPELLVVASSTTHPRATWYPTAPNRVPRETLVEVQEAVRKIAHGSGWPTPISRYAGTDFDRRIAAELYRRMRILPADAASEDVWSFLSLVLLPDVALWRWPNPDRRPRYERLVGRPRNVFRRLWTRIHVLGEDVGGRLYEDEAVGLLERPVSLGGNPRTARAMAAAHLAHVERHPELPRTGLFRNAAVRMNRMAVLISPEALDDRQLTALMTEIFDAAARSLLRSADSSAPR